MLKQQLKLILDSRLAYRLLTAVASLGPKTSIQGSRSQLESLSAKPKPSSSQHSFINEQPDLDLSIIVPVYNMGPYVGQCLDSILSQVTTASFEVIVINDGSTDHSLTAIKSRIDSDQRIVLIDQKNKGYSGARNIGIDRTRGSKLCFVDADDMIAPDHVNNLLAQFMSHPCDFVTGRFTYIDQSGNFMGLSADPRNHGAPWGRIYDRKIWNDIRFPEGYWFEDTLQAFCIDSRYSEFKAAGETGYFYRVHADSQCGKSPLTYKSIDSYWILEDMLDLCRKLSITISQRLYDQTLIQLGPLLRGRTNILNKHERKVLFSTCCDLFQSTAEFQALQTSLSGPWRDLEHALRTRNYYQWVLACRQLG